MNTRYLAFVILALLSSAAVADDESPPPPDGFCDFVPKGKPCVYAVTKSCSAPKAHCGVQSALADATFECLTHGYGVVTCHALPESDFAPFAYNWTIYRENQLEATGPMNNHVTLYCEQNTNFQLYVTVSHNWTGESVTLAETAYCSTANPD